VVAAILATFLAAPRAWAQAPAGQPAPPGQPLPDAAQRQADLELDAALGARAAQIVGNKDVNGNDISPTTRKGLVLIQRVYLHNLNLFLNQLVTLQMFGPDRKAALIRELRQQAPAVRDAYIRFVSSTNAFNPGKPELSQSSQRATYEKTLAQADAAAKRGDAAEAARLRRRAAELPYANFLTARDAFYKALDANPLLGVRVKGYLKDGDYLFNILQNQVDHLATDQSLIGLLDEHIEAFYDQTVKEVERVGEFETLEDFFELGGARFGRVHDKAAGLGALPALLVGEVRAVTEGVTITKSEKDAFKNAVIDLGLGTLTAVTLFIPVVGQLTAGGVTLIQVYRDGSDLVVALVEQRQVENSAGVIGYVHRIQAGEKVEDAALRTVLTVGLGAFDLAGAKSAIQQIRVIRRAEVAVDAAAQARTLGRELTLVEADARSVTFVVDRADEAAFRRLPGAAQRSVLVGSVAAARDLQEALRLLREGRTAILTERQLEALRGLVTRPDFTTLYVYSKDGALVRLFDEDHLETARRLLRSPNLDAIARGQATLARPLATAVSAVTDPGSVLRRIDGDELGRLTRAGTPGDAAFFKRHGLEPVQTIKVGDQTFHVSRPFVGPEGKISVVAFQEGPNGRVIPRTFYLSGEHGVFRVASGSGNGVLQKGPTKVVDQRTGLEVDRSRLDIAVGPEFVNESAVDLAAELQGPLARLVNEKGVVRLPQGVGDRAFYGHLEAITSALEEPIEFGRLVRRADVEVPFAPGGRGARIDPTPLDRYVIDSPVYGRLEGFVYRSVDGSATYVVLRDAQGRVFVPSVQRTSSPLTPFGTRGQAYQTHLNATAKVQRDKLPRAPGQEPYVDNPRYENPLNREAAAVLPPPGAPGVIAGPPPAPPAGAAAGGAGAGGWPGLPGGAVAIPAGRAVAGGRKDDRERAVAGGSSGAATAPGGPPPAGQPPAPVSSTPELDKLGKAIGDVIDAEQAAAAGPGPSGAAQAAGGPPKGEVVDEGMLWGNPAGRHGMVDKAIETQIDNEANDDEAHQKWRQTANPDRTHTYTSPDGKVSYRGRIEGNRYVIEKFQNASPAPSRPAGGAGPSGGVPSALEAVDAEIRNGILNDLRSDPDHWTRTVDEANGTVTYVSPDGQRGFVGRLRRGEVKVTRLTRPAAAREPATAPASGPAPSGGGPGAPPKPPVIRPEAPPETPGVGLAPPTGSSRRIVGRDVRPGDYVFLDGLVRDRIRGAGGDPDSWRLERGAGAAVVYTAPDGRSLTAGFEGGGVSFEGAAAEQILDSPGPGTDVALPVDALTLSGILAQAGLAPDAHPGLPSERDPAVQLMIVDLLGGVVAPRRASDATSPVRSRPLSRWLALLRPGADRGLAARLGPGPAVASAREAWLDPPVEAADAVPATPGGVRLLLTSLGSSSGEAFQAQVVNDTGRPIRLTGDGFVVQPIKKEAQERLRKDLRRDLAGQVTQELTSRLSAYCLEFLRLPPPPGGLFRIAAPELQRAYAPMRRVLQASRRMQESGRLNPDMNPVEYGHAIRQWAIWTREQGFTQETFGKAFVEHTRKSVIAAGRRWTPAVEQAVRSAVPGRWTDITAILAEAGLPAAR
jgi:hypothetical protein